MSLFNKYLTIIQEAFGDKIKDIRAPRGGSNKPTVKPGWQYRDKDYRIETTPYQPESEPLSDEESLKKLQDEDEERNKTKTLSSKDYKEYLKQIQMMHSQTIDSKINEQNIDIIAKQKEPLTDEQKNDISNSISLSYLYSFYMNKKKIESNFKQSLENSILKDPRITIKYIVNVIGKKWDNAKDLIMEIDDNVNNYNFSIEEILNSYNEDGVLQELNLNDKEIQKFKKIYSQFS